MAQDVHAFKRCLNNPPDFLLWHSYLVISAVHILRTSWDFYSIVNVPSTLLSPRLCLLCWDIIYFLTHSPQGSAKLPAAILLLKGLDHFSSPWRNTTWPNHAPSHMQLKYTTWSSVRGLCHGHDCDSHTVMLPGPAAVGNSQFLPLPQHPPFPVLPGLATKHSLHQGAASLTSERPTNLEQHWN